MLPQVTGFPVHLPSFQTSHSPLGLYNDCKGSEAHGPLKRNQTSPIPGRLADQVPVSGGSPSEHSGSGRPNLVLGLDNKSGKIRTETYSGVFVRGLRIPSRFSPCKTHSREMTQTSGFDPASQVKTCFDCKMFDVANWVACLNRENGPGRTPSHEALSVSSQGALEISSVAGQPPSLDRNDFCIPRLVAEPLKRDERCRPSSQRPQYPTLYRRLKRRLGRSLKPKFYKGSVVRCGKKATHKCSGVEGRLSGPSKLQGPVSEPNCASCIGQLNSGSLHKQTRRNSLSGDVCSPVDDHDMVPSFSHNIESQTHPRVSECDGRPSVQVEPSTVDRMVTASAGVQTDLSKVVHTSCRSICHSSEPQTSTLRVSNPRPKCLGHRCSEHRLDGSHCLCLPFDSSPSQGDPKNQAMPQPDHHDSSRLARDALVLGPSTALNRDPTATPGVNNSPQTVPHYVFHNNPQHLNLHAWCLGMDNSKNKASLWRWQRELLHLRGHQQGPSTTQSGPYLRNGAEKIPSVKQISDFFMHMYQDLNRRPSTIDGYRTAIVDPLGPKRMTLGPSRLQRPFTVGYRWTKSCKPVTGKLTTHLQIFT